MAGVAVWGDYFEWEMELASLWADDCTRERSLLINIITEDQIILAGHMDVLNSLKPRKL